jgi:AcrR family transcriptional regulator
VNAAGGADDSTRADGGPPSLRGRAERREEIRAALVVAANGLFAEVGYDAARTGEIAKRAGVAQATLFRHFDTKADLALHHLRRVVDELVASVLERPLHESPYVAVSVVVSEPGVIAALTSDEVRVEGERLREHPELAARVYWMLSDIRHVLADDFATRLGVAFGSARARVLASVVVDAAVYTTEVVGDGADEDPASIYLATLAELRPLLDPGSVSAPC